jgi:hypothetical protein
VTEREVGLNVRLLWGGRPPTASMCQSGGVERHLREASVSEVTAIGLDIAKDVFHARGADATGRAVFSRRLTRGKLLSFSSGNPRCLVALEVCGGAHHRTRELRAMGHDVRLIPPAYVKPFVKRHRTMRWMPKRSARRHSGRACALWP